MTELIRRLCAVDGVSSREEDIRSLIQTAAQPYADNLRTDAIGNLIVFKKGQKEGTKTLVLDAPMDEVGVMISGYTAEGCLRFQCVGDIDRRTLIGKRIYLGHQRLPGIFGMKPIHLTSREERSTVPKLDQLYIDIGAKDEAEAKRWVTEGTVGAFAAGAEPFGSGLLRGKALGSRSACAVLLKLLAQDLPQDCTFVFSAQRAVGARGAMGSAFSVQADTVLTLDGCAAGDFSGVSAGHKICAVGDGVVLSLGDKGTIYDRGLFERLRSLAQTDGIPWQLAAGLSEATDGSAYQRSRSGARVAALKLPVRYQNAPTEVCSPADAEAMLHLAELAVNTWMEE